MTLSPVAIRRTVPSRAGDRLATDKAHRLFVALTWCVCLSIFQGYVVNLGINITLFLLCLMASVRYIDWGVFLRYRFAIFCLALIAVEMVSLSWSPEPFLGVKDASYGLSFMIVLCLAFSLAEQNFDLLVRVGRIYCTAGVVQSLMVILFRLLPSVEAAFWGSPIGAIFISPGALLSDAGVGNVSDPDKAGGVLLAANVAGAWSAAMCFMTFAVFQGTAQTKRMRAIAGIHFVAVYMCGSKASLAIFGGVAALLLLRWLLKGGGDARRRALIWLAIVWIGMALSLVGIDRLFPQNYTGNSAVALSTRSIMWGFAIQVFQQQPWQGLGYGGWHQAFFRIGEANRSNGVSGDLSPHNMFIDLWTQSGMFAVIAGAIIIIIAYWYIVDAFRRADPRAPWLFAALSAYIFQSMGENYMLFSSAYISSVLALSVALTLHSGAVWPQQTRSLV